MSFNYEYTSILLFGISNLFYGEIIATNLEIKITVFLKEQEVALYELPPFSFTLG